MVNKDHEEGATPGWKISDNQPICQPQYYLGEQQTKSNKPK